MDDFLGIMVLLFSFFSLFQSLKRPLGGFESIVEMATRTTK